MALLQRVALERLSDLTQAAVEPVLSVGELTRLLRFAATADEDGNLPDAFAAWEGSTAYGIKERAVPVARNGYVYQVTTAGISGLTEPTWPTTVGLTVSDGTAVWTCEATADWTPSYDGYRLNASAAAGWEMKAGKLSNNETFNADGASFSPEERRDFCLKQAAVFRNKLAGSVRVGTSWDDNRWCAGTIAN